MRFIIKNTWLNRSEFRGEMTRFLQKISYNWPDNCWKGFSDLSQWSQGAINIDHAEMTVPRSIFPYLVKNFECLEYANATFASRTCLHNFSSSPAGSLEFSFPHFYATHAVLFVIWLFLISHRVRIDEIVLLKWNNQPFIYTIASRKCLKQGICIERAILPWKALR